MKKHLLKKIILFFSVAVAVIITTVMLNEKKDIVPIIVTANVSSAETKVVMYKSPTCGCCGLYANYLKDQGMNVEIIPTDDDAMESIKKQYSIPQGKESCHTMVIDDYAVEGHVPIEAIKKLVSEKPVLRGIGLAGMPFGSPGMPGEKNGLLQIYGFTEKGDASLYMEY